MRVLSFKDFQVPVFSYDAVRFGACRKTRTDRTLCDHTNLVFTRRTAPYRTVGFLKIM